MFWKSGILLNLGMSSLPRSGTCTVQWDLAIMACQLPYNIEFNKLVTMQQLMLPPATWLMVSHQGMTYLIGIQTEILIVILYSRKSSMPGSEKLRWTVGKMEIQNSSIVNTRKTQQTIKRARLTQNPNKQKHIFGNQVYVRQSERNTIKRARLNSESKRRTSQVYFLQITG